VSGPANAVPFARVEIVPEAQQAALRVLRSGWITMGPETLAFERELASYLGARQVVAVASGTAAIEIALRALHLPPGAVVLTPSLTFCGAVAAIVQAGLRPALVDVDAGTLLPTWATVAAAVRRVGRPDAMVVQHMAGHPADVPELAEAAGLPTDRVVEDAAHGIGAQLRGIPVGGTSHAACFSFYATKNLPIGEGGAIATDDDKLAGQARVARLHGMSQDAWRRYLPGAGWRYDVAEPGLKANLTDVQAAIGRAQLARLPAWQLRRAELAAAYDAALAGVPGLALPQRPAQGRHAWHLYQVRVRPGGAVPRDQVIDSLARQGIGTSVHFIPVHQLSAYRRILGPGECRSVPVTDQVTDELISLPMYPRLTEAEIERVAHALLAITGCAIAV
jgi:dTDP-4-amino-4,6-dideoxygalactose transaminase